MKETTIFRFITLCLFFLISSNISARHIIGGDISYECLGEGRYKFTMKIYRDCNCQNCADFDQQASVAVYRCNTDNECSRLGQSGYFLATTVPLLSVQQVERPDYPCLIPPDVCVQEGLYEFTLNLPLDTLNSYHISYQRCCRNVTINNIVQPQNSGATYTIELTPAAQRLCNNSPIFSSFPPTVICADAALEYDHSATDPDGDQLVYSFCDPLLGGGPQLDPISYNTCAGANPIPACSPPYASVQFAAPGFTALRPMAGDPVVTINPNTGLITGTPEIKGQFVVGVCVEEYRNGVLLSRVSRDFQFNVASCDALVVADIESDEIIDGQEFLINACGNTAITFNNESYQQSFIDVVEWRFDINNQTQVYTDWSPTVTFPGVGQYSGELILNPNTDCGDTARISVNVFPSIDADFAYSYDTCFAGPVAFEDLSSTGADRITDWNWAFGDGNSSDRASPSHIYREPGEIPVTLTVTDNNKCSDQSTQFIRYFPVPNLIVISPSEFLGCTPADIFFDNLSFPIDTTYDIFWDFGDGGSSGDISPNHIFENPGTYTISLSIVSPIGCETDTIFPDLITVLPSPEAGFSFSPEEPNNLQPTVSFFDASSGGQRWFWDFDDGTNTFERSPTHTFRDTGTYLVKQIVTHPSGCTDTLFQEIDIRPEVRYYLPNAFTPNSDSVNDVYKGVGIMKGAKDFRMTIWNRWGEKVFEADDPSSSWNGRKFNKGKEAPNGVYVVVVNYIGPRGQKFELKGFATVIR